MQTLVQKAMEVLGKLEEGHDSLWSALAVWQKQQSKESLEIAPRRNTRNSKVNTKPPPKKKGTEKTDTETFFWINCSRTFELVLAKSPGGPWWPAFVCHPKDQKMVRALASTNRILLCYVGREELHVVKANDTKKYSPGVKDTIDSSQYDGNFIAKYKSILALARRVYRAKIAEPH